MSAPRPDLRSPRPDYPAMAIGVGLAALGAVVAFDASHLGRGAYAAVGPKSFPFIIAGGLAVLAVWTIVEAWRGNFPERDHDEPGPVLWIVGGLAAQLLLLKLAGFSIATGLLFAATARAFGKRRLHLTIPVGIAFAFAVWVLFTQVLQLALPAGPLEKLLF